MSVYVCVRGAAERMSAWVWACMCARVRAGVNVCANVRVRASVCIGIRPGSACAAKHTQGEERSPTCTARKRMKSRTNKLCRASSRRPRAQSLAQMRSRESVTYPSKQRVRERALLLDVQNLRQRHLHRLWSRPRRNHRRIVLRRHPDGPRPIIPAAVGHR